MLLEKIQSIYNEVTEQSEVILKKRTKINEFIGLSSFSKIHLICAIENEFGVHIPNQDLLSFKTVGDIIKFLNKNGIH